MKTHHPYLRFLLVLLALLLSVPAPPAAGVMQQPAAPSIVEFASSIGGSVKAVALSGGLACIGEGNTLTTLDVRDPARPTRYGQVALPGSIASMQIVDRMVYALAGY